MHDNFGYRAANFGGDFSNKCSIFFSEWRFRRSESFQECCFECILHALSITNMLKYPSNEKGCTYAQSINLREYGESGDLHFD